MAAMGFTPEDYDEGVDIWPENRPVLDLFALVQTQWRIGPAGATGLDYGPLFRVMDELGYRGQAWRDMLDDLRVIELAALAAMAEEG